MKHLILPAIALLMISCSGGTPRERGKEAGKQACECYKLETFDETSACLNEIEKENADFVNDTAYINAMEEQLILCVADGVLDKQ